MPHDQTIPFHRSPHSSLPCHRRLLKAQKAKGDHAACALFIDFDLHMYNSSLHWELDKNWIILFGYMRFCVLTVGSMERMKLNETVHG